MMSLNTPEFTSYSQETWHYLEERPHPWRRSLYVKGRRLRAFNVWMDMKTEGMTFEDAALNWNLPLDAVEEIVRYCEAHDDLLDWEAGRREKTVDVEGDFT
jgi:hypothetical protein